ncbi:GPP34 family phosphoprotein [Streptomyces sp. HUAS MG47]|uniref:GOLPH3/VPS74 family protein n=1 Tax=Streptomyces solicamelliae TaxID=3231716 RepID=UPI003877B66B
MGVTLAEEIMLLSLDDASGSAKQRQAAGWAVAGGILLDLVLDGRVVVSGKQFAVVDAGAVGEPLLDQRVELMRGWIGGRGRRRVADWLTKDQARAVRATLERLCARGIVVEQTHMALGLFPVRRYPEAAPDVEAELRERLRAVVLRGAQPDERTAGLIALLHAAKLHRLAFPDLPRRDVVGRMAQIAEGQWAAEHVRAAIRDMQAAITSVTMVTVIAAGS